MHEAVAYLARAEAPQVSSVTVSWRRLGPTLFAAVTLLLLGACGSLQTPESAQRPRVPGAESTIYVIRRTWHVEVGFAAADLEAPLSGVRADFPGVRYLTFGFGDRHYLLHRSGWTMLGALWPGPGLVLVTGLRATPEEAFGSQDVIALKVDQAQLTSLQQFVWRTLAKPDAEHDGRVAPLERGPYAGSLYYASVQRYSALHTCNTWAAEALQAAGSKVTSRGVEFAGELWVQVKRLHSQQQAAGQ